MRLRFLHVVRSGAGLASLLLLSTSACETDPGNESSSAGAPSGTSGAGAMAGSAGASAPGGTAAVAGTSGAGGATAQSGASGSGGSAPAVDCTSAGLTWKSARKTWYTSYPDPGSEECIEFNGCMWSGLFAACDDKKTEDWVSKHNIVAAFPGFAQLELHDLCLKSGDKTIVVTVLDTCADEDCSGCCTQNQADNDALIDLEKYTNERWGVEDGVIQWADLGPTKGGGCN
jgi:hypothetical protein